MEKIVTFLTYDNQAEEAVNLYTSVFPNARITSTRRYGEAGPGEPGTVMTMSFELEGQEFIALNGGPEFTFNEAISFQIFCDTQEEVDYYWNKLTEDGQESECGWLKDKYGLSWQVIPRVLVDLIADPDPQKAKRATEAMLSMKKLDIAALEKAHAGA